MVEVCCRFLPGEQREVEKEHQLAETAEHDYDRYKLALMAKFLDISYTLRALKGSHRVNVSPLRLVVFLGVLCPAKKSISNRMRHSS